MASIEQTQLSLVAPEKFSDDTVASSVPHSRTKQEGLECWKYDDRLRELVRRSA